MKKFAFIYPLVLFVGTAAQSFGACHAVGSSQTGNGSGSDWNNQMNKLPTTLVRGDTYYLADGSYGAYNFSTANSGTTAIVVKKAQTYDYGRSGDGCSNDISAGWNAGSMGSGQAVFSNIRSGQAIGYFTVDGNGSQTTAPGCGTSQTTNAAAKDCGIKVVDAMGSTGAFNPIGAYASGTKRSNGVTIRYTEVQGAGDSNNSSSVEEDLIWCRDGCDSLTIEHSYWYNSGCDIIKLPYSAGATIRFNVFKQNYSTSGCHGQFYMAEAVTSNVTFSSNVIQDIQGTAIWTFNTGSQASNYNIFNNVLLRTQGSSRPGTSNGIFACINSGSKCANINFIGNSVINYVSDYSGALGVLSENNNGGSYTWRNNLFYNSTSVGFNLHGATLTEDHNTWLNSGSPVNGTGDVTVSTNAPNPFVNWPQGDFRLSSQNAYWSSGAVLASPFNVDLAGNTRPGNDGVWNRGAFDYLGSSSAPLAPSGLTTTAR